MFFIFTYFATIYIYISTLRLHFKLIYMRACVCVLRMFFAVLHSTRPFFFVFSNLLVCSSSSSSSSFFNYILNKIVFIVDDFQVEMFVVDVVLFRLLFYTRKCKNVLSFMRSRIAMYVIIITIIIIVRRNSRILFLDNFIARYYIYLC